MGFKNGCGCRAKNQLAGADALHPACQFINRTFGQLHHALRYAQPGQSALIARTLVNSQHNGLGLVAQQFQVSQCAWRDHPNHLALDRTFGGCHIANLLTNRNGFAQLDEARQVGIDGMKRNACHHHRLPGRLAALGQSDVEEASRFLSIVKEQLIKITHAVKQQGILIVRLDAQILNHHGGMLSDGVCHGVNGIAHC